jgi:hypothetical protein
LRCTDREEVLGYVIEGCDDLQRRFDVQLADPASLACGVDDVCKGRL